METFSVAADRLLKTGRSCRDCADELRRILGQTFGVESCTFDPRSFDIYCQFDPAATSSAAIIREARSKASQIRCRFRTDRWALSGMDCADCADHIREAVERLRGVSSASVNFFSARLEATYDPSEVAREDIERRVRSLGFGVGGQAGERTTETGAPATGGWISALPTMLSGMFLVLAYGLSWTGVGAFWVHLGYAVAMAMGLPIARAGLNTLRTARQADMNLLMTVAAVGAAAIGEWGEAATVIFLFSLGKWLEVFTLDRARHSIRGLLSLTPPQACVLEPTGEGSSGPFQERWVPIEEVPVGSVIRVSPGERIPLDGRVSRGVSDVNESPITGEFAPQEKAVEDPVYAGSLNGEGVLEIEVTRPAQDTLLARIIRLVEEAQTRRTRIQRFVDRFSVVYTPVVIIAAAGVVIVGTAVGGPQAFSEWFYRGLALLVVACPCALVISTPVAIVAGLAAAARHGVLVKGGEALERVAGVRAIALDKTGTLTEGQLRVVEVRGAPGKREEEVLAVAAAVEEGFAHPIARAIVAEAQHRGLEVPLSRDHARLEGLAASAVIGGVLHAVGRHTVFNAIDPGLRRWAVSLAKSGRIVVLVGPPESPIGLVALADTSRKGLASITQSLRDLGMRHLVMLTGDSEAVASEAALHADLDDFRARLLPEQKVDAIKELTRTYGAIAMVGDGINDAPALAAAHVGIAMGAAGTDAALEAADVALMGDDLSKLPFLVYLARATRRLMQQNIAISLLLKAIFLSLIVPGWLTLWLAVAGDMGVSLLVIANSMRLLALRPDSTMTNDR